MRSPLSKLPLGFKILHWAILLNFLFEVAYAGYVVFFVLRPEGVSGPLFGAARSIPHELMMTRRAYATEFWIAFSGLAIYFALTELLPRVWVSFVKNPENSSDSEAK